ILAAREHIRQSEIPGVFPSPVNIRTFNTDAGYACGMTAGTALDPALTWPLYTLAEAAAIVDVPPSTLHTWARGRSYKGIDGGQYSSDALITTTGTGRGAVVPFVGLAEAYVLAGFR